MSPGMAGFAFNLKTSVNDFYVICYRYIDGQETVPIEIRF